MKIIYHEIDKMIHRYVRYVNPQDDKSFNKEEYEKKIVEFIERLNQLEKEFGFSITSDYYMDYDEFITSSIELYDNKYGHVGEISEEE